MDLLVGARADDLNKRALIGAKTLHGLAQGAGVKVGAVIQHGDEQVFEMPAGLGLEVLFEILAIHGLELQCNLEALCCTAVCKDVDQGLLIRAHA